MKILLTIMLSLTVGLAFGQTKGQITAHGTGLYLTIPKPDTIQVISFCIDTATLETKWRKLYGIKGYGMTALYAYGFWMYKQYLMPDRKTPCTYKVIYSLDSN